MGTEIQKRETTPPGYEHVVQALKRQQTATGTPSNPWAVAWAMHGRGIKPKSEAGVLYDGAALFRRYRHECMREMRARVEESGMAKEASFFADCPRDDKGRCVSGGDSVSAGASPGIMARAGHAVRKGARGVAKALGIARGIDLLYPAALTGAAIYVSAKTRKGPSLIGQAFDQFSEYRRNA